MKSDSLYQQWFEFLVTLVAHGGNLTNNSCRGLVQ